MKSAPIMLMTALALTGCAADTKNYPSLSRRAVERGGSDAPATATPAMPLKPPSADQLALMAASVARATQAHAKFGEASPRVQQRVDAGSGTAPGSEAWAVASVALAELESTRSAAMIALADLDQLYAAARVEGSETAEIIKARDEVTRLISEEDRVLAALRGKLGG